MSTKSKRSTLLTSEDYWAIWAGGFLLIIGLIIYLGIAAHQFSDESTRVQAQLKEQQSVPFKTVEWYRLKDRADQLTGARSDIGKSVKMILSKPHTWKNNILESIYSVPGKTSSGKPDMPQIQLATLEEDAMNKQAAAKDKNYSDTTLNELAASSALLWHDASLYLEKMKKSQANPGYNLVIPLLLAGTLMGLLFGIGAISMGKKWRVFAAGFAVIFLISTLAFILEAQADMKSAGIGYALWAILLGMIISNTIGTPPWLKEAAMAEFYIKTGLVLLGAEVLLGKIMAIGLPGIFVAWVVTPVVLVSTFWFGQKILKISSKTLNITISADMSVCGISAAIATAAACNAKKEELTTAVGLSMVFTSIMMVALPMLIKALDMPQVLGGAWIGGTIDSTGAVVAAGAFLGDKALNVAATIKMIQNIMIGVVAFGVALYWATRVENTGKSNVGFSEIWLRFPKFVLGFFGASLVFSILALVLPREVSSAYIDQGIIGGFTKELYGWFFCLAFTSIGLSVNFKELRRQFSGGKPLILYVCGQTLNLILTLIMAYLMFYIVFPDITSNI